ncbi:hypothetical protein AGMMS49521_1920 [Campylobacterota bacterium]|nr:hypothetical protein AGMMS49521_1920 [Campylobacterota bacterium]
MKKSKAESAGDELYTTYETVGKILRTHIADGKLRSKRILCSRKWYDRSLSVLKNMMSDKNTYITRNKKDV